MVSSTTRPHFTHGKDPVPILQEAGWAPVSVWTSGKSRPYRDSIPDRPARSQSLYRLSYPTHNLVLYYIIFINIHLYKNCKLFLTDFWIFTTANYSKQYILSSWIHKELKFLLEIMLQYLKISVACVCLLD